MNYQIKRLGIKGGVKLNKRWRNEKQKKGIERLAAKKVRWGSKWTKQGPQLKIIKEIGLGGQHINIPIRRKAEIVDWAVINWPQQPNY